MNHPACLIGLFASHGFQLTRDAIFFLQVHDCHKILKLFKESSPETLVIDLPAIRRLYKAKRGDVITINVMGFKQVYYWHVYDDIERRCQKTLLKSLEKIKADVRSLNNGFQRGTEW
jgi:hypothetical protein